MWKTARTPYLQWKVILLKIHHHRLHTANHPVLCPLHETTHCLLYRSTVPPHRGTSVRFRLPLRPRAVEYVTSLNHQVQCQWLIKTIKEPTRCRQSQTDRYRYQFILRLRHPEFPLLLPTSHQSLKRRRFHRRFYPYRQQLLPHLHLFQVLRYHKPRHP